MTLNTSHRFDALDAWRGVCACLVVLLHFNHVVVSHLNGVRLVENAYMFVDFFFVLSGFVIATSYNDRLLGGFPLKNYIALRLGRVYPLHIVVLLGFVGFECLKFFMDTKTPPFSADANDLPSLIANIFLVQSLGLFDRLSWNFPAWSISVEFFTYILYALALVALRGRIWIAALLFVIGTPFAFAWLGVETINVSHDYGLLRCVYGFSAGILCLKIYDLLRAVRLSFTAASLLEIALMAGIAAFVMLAHNRVSYFSPYLFSLVVLVFAFQRGAISALFTTKPFLILGMLSYSIYMTHALIQLFLSNVAKIMADKINLAVLSDKTVLDTDQPMIGATALQGDVWQATGLVAVILFSFFTYYLVEKPANEWVRRRFGKRDGLERAIASKAAF